MESKIVRLAANRENAVKKINEGFVNKLTSLVARMTKSVSSCESGITVLSEEKSALEANIAFAEESLKEVE